MPRSEARGAPGNPAGVGVVKRLRGKTGATAAWSGVFRKQLGAACVSVSQLPRSAGLHSVGASGWNGMSLRAHPAAEDNLI